MRSVQRQSSDNPVNQLVVYNDTVAERLRRLTRNQLGLSRVGSSPASVGIFLVKSASIVIVILAIKAYYTFLLTTMTMMRPLLLLLLPFSVLAQTLTGKIISCSGWKLNRYPHLKSFLKDYEAEEYRNVELQFVKGKAAVLSIFSDGELKEEVDMHQYGTKEELHTMMVEKGFVRMPEDEVVAMKEQKAFEQAEDKKRKEEERAFNRNLLKIRREEKEAEMERATLEAEEKQKAEEQAEEQEKASAAGEEL